MTKRVSAREARAHFAELTDEVRYTGEPVIVEKQGRPFVAVISVEDLESLERLRREDTEHGKETTRDYFSEPEQEDEEIVRAVKKIREEINREWYGDP